MAYGSHQAGRLVDQGKPFVLAQTDEGDPQLVQNKYICPSGYAMRLYLWCSSLSHHQLCTAKINVSIQAQFLIPLTNETFQTDFENTQKWARYY